MDVQLFQLDSYTLQMLCKALLEPFKVFCLLVSFVLLINIASRIMGVNQASAAQLYSELILLKNDQILYDPTGLVAEICNGTLKR